jgi:hypothetical protein
MYHDQGDSDSQASDTAKADTRRYSHGSVNVYNVIRTQCVVFVCTVTIYE